MYFGELDKALLRAALVIAAIAFAGGALAAWGLPRLWLLLKPWLHALTA